jgi:hypothetical protein
MVVHADNCTHNFDENIYSKKEWKIYIKIMKFEVLTAVVMMSYTYLVICNAVWGTR